MLAYDNRNGNRLRHAPLPDRLRERAEVNWEHRDTIAHNLSTELKEWEVNEVVRRMGVIREAGTFL